MHRGNSKADLKLVCIITAFVLFVSLPAVGLADAFTANTLGDYGNVTVMEVNGIPAVIEGNTFTAAGVMLKDG